MIPAPIISKFLDVTRGALTAILNSCRLCIHFFLLPSFAASPRTLRIEGDLSAVLPDRVF